MRKWQLFSLIMFAMLCMTANTLKAQDVPITGTVLSDDGTPLSGVTVAVNGTKRAVVTNDKGEFTIHTKEGSTLLLTYVGYTGQKLKATAGMVIRLSAGGSSEMGGVVVTAMGIKRERKALGYSVTELSSAELMKNKNANIVNSLDGKVPGVNVTQFSGSPGAGASITIRGGNSTSDSRQNQPLFVVDGVIYDNSTTVVGNTGTDGLSRDNTTYSNRVMDINPEDIESLSVLKGAAAAALYGSRAADGVVIITTKKGAEGTTKVSVASKVSSSWADKVPQIQQLFGNGIYAQNGVFNNIGIGGITGNSLTTNIQYYSWGPQIPADSAKYDNIGNFFRHGIVYDNNVNVSGGSKNGSFFLSASNYDQTGIVPKTGYDKTTFRFNGEQRYAGLTLTANAAYSIAKINRTLTNGGLYGGGGNGALGAVYSWPVTFNMKNYLNVDGSQYRPFAGSVPLEQDQDNPYWILNEDQLTEQTNRFTGGINANYKITSWWDVTGRVGYDTYNTNDYTYIAPGSAVSPTYQNGRLSKDFVGYTYITTTELTTFHKTFGDFETHLMLGNMTENTESPNQNLWGFNFITAGKANANFANIATTNQFFADALTRHRLTGAFGEVGVSYKDIVYLTATGRNDWSSTLPVHNQSYFYPSVSGAFNFTSLLPRNTLLSFGKLRGSWAQVGKDANPYATLTYENPPITIGNFNGVGNQYTSGNPYLKPEIQSSWEVGGELRFLNGRIGVDYTYYHSQTKNQIAQPRLSNANGYILTSINSGSVTNKGMEVAVTGKPIAQKDFSWDATINFSYNRGRLGTFLPGVSLFYPTDAQFGTVKAASAPNGGYFLGLAGNRFYHQLDAKGNELPNGPYQVDPTTGLYKVNTTTPILANREPDFIGGFENTFRYKKWQLAVLFDIRKGGAVYNGTEYALIENGLSKRTLLNGRQSVTVSGVNSQTGAPFSQTYNANQSYTIGTTTYDGKNMIELYWQNYANNSYNLIQSVNWVKLRSVSLTYDFIGMLSKQKVIKDLSLTAVGSNLFTWTNYKGMDPEVSAGGGTGGSGSTGIDYLGVPAVAAFTLGLNVTF
jgi:ferric enterobactin receptor